MKRQREDPAEDEDDGQEVEQSVVKTPLKKQTKVVRDESDGPSALNRLWGYFSPRPPPRMETQEMDLMTGKEEEAPELIQNESVHEETVLMEEQKGDNNGSSKKIKQAEEEEEDVPHYIRRLSSPPFRIDVLPAISSTSEEDFSQPLPCGIGTTTALVRIPAPSLHDKAISNANENSLLMERMNVRWLYIRNDLQGALDLAINVLRSIDTAAVIQPSVLQQLKSIVYYDMTEIVCEMVERKEGVSRIFGENRCIAEALINFEKNVSVAVKQLRRTIGDKKEQSKHVMSLVHYLLAQCLTMRKGGKDLTRAKNNIERALDLDPNPVYHVYNLKGTCHFTCKEYREAIESYSTGIELLAASCQRDSPQMREKTDTMLFYNRAEAYYMLKEFNLAENDLRTVLRASKSDKASNELMKKVGSSKAKQDKARK